MRCLLALWLVVFALSGVAFLVGAEGPGMAALLVVLILTGPLVSWVGDRAAWRTFEEVERLEAAGDLEGALAALDRHVSQRPADHAARARRGLLRLSRGDRAGALEDADAVLTRSPLQAEALDLLVASTALEPEPTRRLDALQQLERRLSLTLDALGDSPALLRARANTRLQLDDHWGARHDVERALALGDRDPRTGLAKVWALAAVDELAPALRLVDELVADPGPRGRAALPVRAWLRLVAGDAAGAVHDLNDLTRYSPDDGDARAQRGIALAVEGDLEAAAADLQRAAELDLRGARARLWLTMLGRPAPEGAAPASRWDVALTRALRDGGDPLAVAALAVSEAERRACLRHVHAARALLAERAGDPGAACAAWSEVAALTPALDPLPAWARRRLQALGPGEAPAPT